MRNHLFRPPSRVGFGIALGMTFAMLAIGCASSQSTQSKEDIAKAKAEAAYKSGHEFEQQGKTDEAITEYESALKADPKHRPTLRAIAHLYGQREDYTKAAEYWKRFAEASDYSASACNDLAFCYDLAGRPKQAEYWYRRALEDDPRHLFANVNYGMMLARHGRGTEALCQLQAVLPPAEARYQLGIAYEEVGQRLLAEAEFRKALELDPNFEQAKVHLKAADASAKTD